MYKFKLGAGYSGHFKSETRKGAGNYLLPAPAKIKPTKLVKFSE
jgi:hypothetical protein